MSGTRGQQVHVDRSNTCQYLHTYHESAVSSLQCYTCTKVSKVELHISVIHLACMGGQAPRKQPTLKQNQRGKRKHSSTKLLAQQLQIGLAIDLLILQHRIDQCFICAWNSKPWLSRCTPERGRRSVRSQPKYTNGRLRDWYPPFPCPRPRILPGRKDTQTQRRKDTKTQGCTGVQRRTFCCVYCMMSRQKHFVQIQKKNCVLAIIV